MPCQSPRKSFINSISGWLSGAAACSSSFLPKEAKSPLLLFSSAASLSYTIISELPGKVRVILPPSSA